VPGAAADVEDARRIAARATKARVVGAKTRATRARRADAGGESPKL
jgi:hypothetical protein